jgi:hypothetical protein
MYNSIDFKRFSGPEYPFFRDAYQIAENTPRSRHGDGCRSYGVGALVTDVETFPVNRVCSCLVVREAQDHIDRARAVCTECPDGCSCYC